MRMTYGAGCSAASLWMLCLTSAVADGIPLEGGLVHSFAAPPPALPQRRPLTLGTTDRTRAWILVIFVIASALALEREHRVAYYYSVYADIHAVCSNTQQARCKVMDILTSTPVNSEIRARIE